MAKDWEAGLEAVRAVTDSGVANSLEEEKAAAGWEAKKLNAGSEAED